MFLASRTPRWCPDHGYFPLLLRTEANTVLNIWLDFSGWKVCSFSIVMLFSTPNIPRTNTPNEGCQHCSASNPDNPLISSFNVNVSFHRLGFMTYYHSKYISIINAKTEQVCAGQTVHNRMGRRDSGERKERTFMKLIGVGLAEIKLCCRL